jgi:rubrerythrin
MAFKDGFSKITKSLSENASSVMKKSNDLIEITKFNNEVESEEKKKGILYLSIGQLVYINYISKIDVNEEIKNKCEAIFKHDEEIKKIKGQILDIKKIKKCSNCGVEMKIDISFCPSCGNKQEVILDKNSAEVSDSIEDEVTL